MDRVDVDFSDERAAEAWFEEQNTQTRCAVTSRGALRILPNIVAEENSVRNSIGLASLRSTLISATFGSGYFRDIRGGWKTNFFRIEAKLDAADDDDFSEHLSVRVARSAALSAALSPISAVSATLSTISALSAARSALSPMQWDAAQDCATLATAPLWSRTEVPEEIARNHEAFLSFLRSDHAWAFWLRFYEGMWNGTFTEWPLALDVIGIEEEDWEQGYKHIAGVIAGLEEKYKAKPLDQDALVKHLGQIIDFPTLHHDFAKSVGTQVSGAISAYKQAAPANCLPDGFQQFEHVPNVFENIANILASDEDKDAKIATLQDEVNALHAVIVQLRLDLNAARLELTNGKMNAVEVSQMRTFGEKAQTFLTNVTLLGAIGMGAFHFFGVDENELKYETLKAQLDSLTEQMQAIEETEEVEPAP